MSMVSTDTASGPRGILTRADREFLMGERELGSPQARCNARARIRKRVEQAFKDMMYLWRGLREDDLSKIVQPENKDAKIGLRKAFQDTIALTVRAIDLANDDKPMRISSALIQAGATDQFNPREDEQWDSSVSHTIPVEFVLEYPSKDQSESVEHTEQDTPDDFEKSGVGNPSRVEWDEMPGPIPWDRSDKHDDPSQTVEAMISEGYNNFGYVTHEMIVQDPSISAEVITRAYNEFASTKLSPSFVRRERKCWSKLARERPLFFYPMYRKSSGDSEEVFDQTVWSPWYNDTLVSM